MIAPCNVDFGATNVNSCVAFRIAQTSGTMMNKCTLQVSIDDDTDCSPCPCCAIWLCWPSSPIPIYRCRHNCSAETRTTPPPQTHSLKHTCSENVTDGHPFQKYIAQSNILLVVGAFERVGKFIASFSSNTANGLDSQDQRNCGCIFKISLHNFVSLKSIWDNNDEEVELHRREYCKNIQ